MGKNHFYENKLTEAKEICKMSSSLTFCSELTILSVMSKSVDIGVENVR